MKQIIVVGIVAIWTLMCIYGTYCNTVRSAEVHPIEGGYEIEFHNTGQIYEYEGE